MADVAQENLILFPACWYHPRRSNCLFWALEQRRRFGGYVAARRSTYGWWHHYAWSPDGLRWFEYNPTWPKKWWLERWWRRWFPPPLFTGVIEEVDLHTGLNLGPSGARTPLHTPTA